MFVLLYIGLIFCLHSAPDFNSLSINDQNIDLNLMGELEGTSIIIKIKDENKKNIAVFKPTSGNNIYRGEYAMFKMAKLLGIDAIYPPTKIDCMNIETQEKVKRLLEDIKYNIEVTKKEENRLIILEELKLNIKKNKELCGSLKKWINNLSFYYMLGTKENLVEHTIHKYMKADGAQPPHKKFIIKQCTNLFDRPCMRGNGYLDEMAKDMSSIMLLDAVMGNSDRFPGGNLHFTVSGTRARLFSLDNGAVLKPLDKSALNTLKETDVSRFNKTVVNKLKHLNTKTKTEIIKLLSLSPEEYETFKSNLIQTLEYIEELQEKYGKKIWFKAT